MKDRAARHGGKVTMTGDVYTRPTNIQRTFDALSPTKLKTAREIAKDAGMRKNEVAKMLGELIESGAAELVHNAPTYRLVDGALRPTSRWDRLSQQRRKRFHMEAAAALRENDPIRKKF